MKMMNHIIIPDQSSKGKGQDRKESFSLLIYLFFLNSHCTYFEKCQRALLSLVLLGTTWFAVPLSNLLRCHYQEENI